MHHVAQGCFADECGGEADGAFEAEVVGDVGAAEVGVDDADALAVLGVGEGEVAHDGGFTFALDGGGKHLDGCFAGGGDEHHVGADLAEFFGDNGGWVFVHWWFAGGEGVVCADFADDGAVGDLFGVFGAAHDGVEHGAGQGDADGGDGAE